MNEFILKNQISHIFPHSPQYQKQSSTRLKDPVRNLHALTAPRHRRHTIASSSLSSPSPCSLEYLARLRCEAFRELERQTQAYNDQMVARMRFVESLSPEEQRAWFAKLARAERFADKDTDPEIDELVKTMADGVRVTDYSPLLEWEIRQVCHFFITLCLQNQ